MNVVSAFTHQAHLGIKKPLNLSGFHRFLYYSDRSDYQQIKLEEVVCIH